MLSPALRLQEESITGGFEGFEDDPEMETMALTLNTALDTQNVPLSENAEDSLVEAAASSPLAKNGKKKKKMRKKRSRFSQALDKPRAKGIFNRTSLFECLWETVIPPDLPVRSLRPCALCVADITYEDKSRPCPHVRYGTMPKTNNSQNVLQLDPLNKTFALSENWKTDSTFVVQVIVEYVLQAAFTVSLHFSYFIPFVTHFFLPLPRATPDRHERY